MYSLSNAKKVVNGINIFIHETNEIVIDKLISLTLENIPDLSEEQKDKLNNVGFNLKDQLFKESLLTTIQQKKKKTGPKRPPTEYNIFVKNTIQDLKEKNPELKNTELMASAAKLWRIKKEENNKEENNKEENNKE
jgi:hypothetical protein